MAVDAAIRARVSVAALPFCLFAGGRLDWLAEAGLVVGMNPLKELFESGQTILWIETQNTVAFVRPIPDVLVWTGTKTAVQVRTACPTDGLAQPLRFRQVRFTAPEGFLGAFAIFDVGRDPIPLDDVSIFISERHSAVQLPAILPIRAAGTHLTLVRLARINRLHPLILMSLKVARANYHFPPCSRHLLRP